MGRRGRTLVRHRAAMYLAVAASADPVGALLAVLREQAERLLKRVAVLGRRLTVGKLAQAIGLDYQRHRRAWTTAWLT